MKRDREEIIEDLRKLIASKGYIYSLCMIIFDDFHVSLEDFHKSNRYKKLNFQEVTYVIGLLVQDKLDFSCPNDPDELIYMKKKTYELMEELHTTYSYIFSDYLMKMMKDPDPAKSAGDISCKNSSVNFPSQSRQISFHLQKWERLSQHIFFHHQ